MKKQFCFFEKSFSLMPRFLFILLLLVFPLEAPAQQAKTQPARRQYDLLVGSAQTGVGGTFRLSQRLAWQADFGFGANYIHSDFYGRYQQSPDPHKQAGTLLNLGEIWWTFYLNNELRFWSKNQSTYFGLKLKTTFPETFILFERDPGKYPYRSTYKIGPIIGGQFPLDSKGSWRLDLQLGLGLIVNHNFSHSDRASIGNIAFCYRMAPR